MHPTLLELRLGGHAIALDANGLCILLGAIAGLALTLSIGRARGMDRTVLRDLGLELVLVGVIGARLGFLLASASKQRAACAAALESGAVSDCARPLWLWEGGMSFQGGLLVASAWLLWRASRRGMPVLALADVFTPGLALGHVFARIGCFLGGCCFGQPTTGPLGLRFPDESAAYEELARRGQLPPSADFTPPLHAVQLYDAASHLLLCIALALLLRRRATRPGLVLALYFGGHALISLVLLPFRAHGR